MQAKNTTPDAEKRECRNAWHRTPEAQAKRRARNNTPDAIERRKAYNKQWYETDKEHQKELSAKWSAANKDRIAAAAKSRYDSKKQPPKVAVSEKVRREKKAANNREWRARNRERVRANKKAWEAANPEKAKASHSARNKKYTAKLPEEMLVRRRANSKRWGDANPEKRAHFHSKGHVKRKARLKDAGQFTLQEWHQLLDATGHKCVCCGISESAAIYRFPKRGEPLRGQLTRDHILPLCKNGANTISNIQPTCLPCNMRKRRQYVNYLTNDANPGANAG